MLNKNKTGNVYSVSVSAHDKHFKNNKKKQLLNLRSTRNKKEIEKSILNKAGLWSNKKVSLLKKV